MEKNKPKVRFKGFDEDWKSEDVGKYYDFKNGLNKGKEYFGYGTPIVNFTDVFHSRGLYINNLKGKVYVNNDELKNYSVKKGDLFFTRTSETIEEIGFPSVMLDDSENTVFSGFVLRARPLNSDPLVNDFKKYVFFIESFRSEMIKKSSMTTRALTSGTAIKKMLFSFPKNKSEQQKIGSFFENLDKLITEHQQKLGKLKALKKAMLSKMFPKQGQTVPEIRFKGFTGDWEEKKMDEIGKATSGTSIESEFDKNGIYKVISIGSYSENSTYTDQGLRVNFSEKIQSRILNENDLAMVLNDKTASGNILGRVLLIKEDNKFVYNQRTQRIEPYVDNYNPLFLYHLFNAPYIRNKILKICQGNTQIYVNWTTVKELKYLIPQKDEQIKIGNYFKNLDNLISNHELQISKLQNIKKAFLAKMFI